MERNQPKRETLAFTNPNKAWVIKELHQLIAEWRSWQKDVEEIKDHPYNHQTHSEIYADGEENIKRHRILQEKTLVFLENNISGHGFIRGRDGTKIDRDDLRLAIRVKHRIDDLDELSACLSYAKVPDGYWRTKAAELVSKIAGKAPDVAIDLATKYLQGGV
jgi:hypothetical protein